MPRMSLRDRAAYVIVEMARLETDDPDQYGELTKIFDIGWSLAELLRQGMIARVTSKGLRAFEELEAQLPVPSRQKSRSS